MKNKRKTAIAVASVAATFALGLGFATLNPVTTTAEAVTLTFDTATMIEGASVRYGGEKTTNGMKFAFNLGKTEYEKLLSAKSSGQITDLTFGVLIAPEVYSDHYALNAANVFGIGGTAVYGWAEKVGGVWQEYTGDLVEIMNFSTTKLTEYTADSEVGKPGTMYYEGSIVDLLDGDAEDVDSKGNIVNNLDREFRGVGYVKYTENGTAKCLTFGDVQTETKTVRSMAYVAQLAIRKGHSGSTWLQQNYVDKVTDVAASYTEQYYLETAEGGYVLASGNTVTGKTIDDEVTIADKSFEGYVFDEANENNLLSGKVFANGHLTLKKYYKSTAVTMDAGLINVDETATLDVSALTGTKKLYKTLGVTQTEVKTVEGTTLDLTGLNGTYIVRATDSYGGNAGAITFDAYSATADLEWNAIAEDTGAIYSVPNATPASNTTVAVSDNAFTVTSVGGEEYYFAILPVHSKAYYAQHVNYGIKLTFDYTVTATTANGYPAIAGVYGGTVDTETWSKIAVGEAHTASVSIDWLVENWATMETQGLLQLGSYYQGAGGVLDPEACVSSTLTVKNVSVDFRMSESDLVDGGEKLVEVESKEYDLTNLLEAGEKSLFEGYEKYATVVWTLAPTNGGAEVSANGSTVDFKTLEKRLYTVTATVDGVKAYTAEVDFYSMDDPFTWNTVSTLNDIDLRKADGATASLATDPMGREGTYYQIDVAPRADSEGTALKSSFAANFMPVHSQAYYKLYEGQGVNFVLDYYIDTPVDTYTVVFVGYAGNKQRAGQTWLTETISLDTILTSPAEADSDWESVFTDKYNGGWQDAMMTFNPFVLEETISFYVGNFRSSITVDSVIEDTADYLINVADKTSYNMTSHLGDTLTGYGENLVWSFTPYFGGTTVTVEGNTVDMTKVEQRYYNVSANLSKYGMLAPVYTGTVDFCDESKAVWNDVVSVDDVATTADSVELVNITTSDLAQDRAGAYFKFTHEFDGTVVGGFDSKYAVIGVMPMHSNAYYARLEGTAVLKYDIYATATGVNSSGETATVTFFDSTAGVNNGWNRKAGVTLNTWSATVNKYNTITELAALSWAKDKTNVNYWQQFTVDQYYSGSVSLKEFTLYLGNFRFELAASDATTDTADHLIDVNGKATYDMMEHLSTTLETYADTSLTWNFTPYFGGTTTTLKGNEIDLSKLENRYYNVTASTLNYGLGSTVYTGTVDFYNSTEAPVWNNSIQASDVTHTADTMEVVDITTKDFASTYTGNYVKLYKTFDDNISTGRDTAETFKVTVMPIHSKAYYAQEAEDLTLYFSAYAITTGVGTATPTTYYYTTESTYNAQVSINKWNNLTCNTQATLAGYTWSATGIGNYYSLIVRDFWSQAASTKTCEIYVGNFHFA